MDMSPNTAFWQNCFKAKYNHKTALFIDLDSNVNENWIKLSIVDTQKSWYWFCLVSDIQMLFRVTFVFSDTAYSVYQFQPFDMCIIFRLKDSCIIMSTSLFFLEWFMQHCNTASWDWGFDQFETALCCT